MDFGQGLRILVVVAMGWVVAHSARVLLEALGGHVRLARRAVIGELLTAVGTFLIAWGLLPGGSSDAESMFMLVGSLVWAVGIVSHPPARGSSDN